MEDDVRRKNLIEWKPGQSGNPKGKPHGAVSMKNRIERILECTVDDLEGEGFPEAFLDNWRVMYGNSTVANAMVVKMLSNAMLKKNSERGMRDLMDRLEGRVPQTIDLNANAGRPEITAADLENMSPEKALQMYQQMLKDTSVVINVTPQETDEGSTDSED